MICAANDDGVHMIEFADREILDLQIKRVKKLTQCTFVQGEIDFHFQMKAELDEYFEGILRQFETPIVLKGTRFQKAVWKQLLKIDYGQTKSYEWIANRINNPKAQRAVGKANGESSGGYTRYEGPGRCKPDVVAQRSTTSSAKLNSSNSAKPN